MLLRKAKWYRKYGIIVLTILVIAIYCIAYFHIQHDDYYIPSLGWLYRNRHGYAGKHLASAWFATSRYSIAIVVFVKSPGSGLEDYRMNIETLECYAGVQSYSFHLFFMEHHDEPPESKWERAIVDKCLRDRLEEERQRDVFTGDFTYLRMCGVVEFMAAHPEHDFVMLLDADMGVINPRRRLEEFIDEEVNLVFYEREWSWEIMSGSYLARNNEKTRYFLKYWYEYMWDYGKSMNLSYYDNPGYLLRWNRDNGPLHDVFMHMFASASETERCRKIAERVDHQRNVFTYYVFIACIRYFLGMHGNATTARSADSSYYYYNATVGRVKVLPRFKAWVRDGTTAVTETWNHHSDFMLHGWKKRNADIQLANRSDPFGQYWTIPFVGKAPFPTELCTAENRDEIIDRYWKQRWREELMISDLELNAVFSALTLDVQALFAQLYTALEAMFAGLDEQSWSIADLAVRKFFERYNQIT